MRDAIDSALNPALGQTRSRERPLTPKEQMQLTKARCAAEAGGPTQACTGVIFVGMFFDGTGNNENEDYKDPVNRSQSRPARRQKHSNVVRLYHAFPDKVKSGTTGHYAHYVPGVGTPFKEIGDDGQGFGGEMAQNLGSIGAWYGEPRIIWGLTRMFNAISQYALQRDIISDRVAASLADDLSGVTSFGWKRRKELKDVWQARLKAQLVHRKPEITQINVSVFGFSRGAAEARAFVNWLFEICEQKDGAYLFAGIPLRVQFLGLFDTVASVGAAGLYSLFEGRQSWAWNNMQVHPGVEQCLHLAAGHEVRACFPLDSVRIEGRYPPNVKEYMYPGSHSDVGGGYIPMCLGKNDWEQDDRQLARIPGYEMYCAAIAAGVPFIPMSKLQEPVAKALMPHSDTVRAFNNYYKAANIQPGPVEEMHRQHMGHYFTYRWQMLNEGLQKSAEWVRAGKRPNQGKNYEDEQQWMQATQRALIQVVAALLSEIDRRIQSGTSGWSNDARLKQPLAFDLGVQLLSIPTTAEELARKGISRRNRLRDGEVQANAAVLAARAPEYLAKWRKWLSDNLQAEVHDVDIEREPILLLEALKPKTLSSDVSNFFSDLLHDSMAGFIGFGMPEFQANGFGLAKFRRVYAGNDGDEFLRNLVIKSNREKIMAAEARRAQAAKWKTESENFRRANPNPW